MKRIISLLLVMLLLGCTSTPLVDETGATPENTRAVVDANNMFAFDLFARYNNQTNLFFSPYSISTALAMTYEGARGQTKEEMQKVFYFPEDMGPNMAAIYNRINNHGNEYRLSTANALWAEESYPFLAEYFDEVEKRYGAKVTNMDFVGNTEDSRREINTWVQEKTEEKIKELIPQGVITTDTRLVLTNAIYFKGKWVLQFDPKNTYEMDFYLAPEERVSAQMMTLSGEKAKFNYARTDDVQIIELPYDGDKLSMFVYLPSEAGNYDISYEDYNAIKTQMTKQRVDLWLPKFKLETKYFMARDLAEMGMPTAFGMDADFSGMTGDMSLYISHVIHQAFVEVNEEGTEAAASTAVIIAEKAVAIDHEIFMANRPFIFTIEDKESGEILFMGRVDDPR